MAYPAAMIIEVPGLLSASSLAELTAALRGAAFDDGKATAHGAARAVKHNRQLAPEDPLARRWGQAIAAAFSCREDAKNASLPHTIMPFRFRRYQPGMGYGDHVDLPVMATARGPLRTDLAMTVWISDPGDYDGGELVIHTAFGDRAIKRDAGAAVIYPATMVHRVNPVTRGERLVAISWIQSLVRDPTRRGILADVMRCAAMEGTAVEGDEREGVLQSIQHRLMRMWADC